MVKNDDGTITVTFNACRRPEMYWHLYSRGDKVEILEPEERRTMIEGYGRADFKALP